MILLRAAAFACALAAIASLAAPATAADPAKLLRLAGADIDTLDPHQLQDVYSRDVASVIFEGLYEWSYLERPAVPVPRTAVALPEISADGRTWTIRLKSGIRFTADPAFGGKPRELTAEDYVYSIKRYLDPNLRGGGEPLTSDLIVGMRAVVEAARKPGARLDYDAPVEGLQALDRYTLQLKLREANYPVAVSVLQVSAVAREVVEAARGDIQARVVGTGPYRLALWQRGSRVVLEANPDYRPLAFPDSRDPAHAALVESMRGRKLPAIGRIELAVIDEQPVRVLEFDRGTLDVVVLRGEAVAPLLPDGELAPALAARGIGRIAYATNSVRSIYFNMDDPVAGGTSRERIALRRAIALAIDVESLIRVVYAGQGLAANQLVPPGISGFDPTVPPREYDPRLASALLDRMGYGKRDARGYRLAPDGKPLTLTMTIFTAAVWREIQTLLHKNLEAIGLRIEFRPTPVQDLFKEAAQGRFMLNIHGRSASPDGLIFLTFYGPSPAEANESRFRSAEYDRALEAFLRARDDAARMRAARTMIDVLRVYVPAIPLLVDVQNAFTQPWLLGYYPSPFAGYFQYLDLDVSRRR